MTCPQWAVEAAGNSGKFTTFLKDGQIVYMGIMSERVRNIMKRNTGIPLLENLCLEMLEISGKKRQYLFRISLELHTFKNSILLFTYMTMFIVLLIRCFIIKLINISNYGVIAWQNTVTLTNISPFLFLDNARSYSRFFFTCL